MKSDRPDHTSCWLSQQMVLDIIVEEDVLIKGVTAADICFPRILRTAVS